MSIKTRHIYGFIEKQAIKSEKIPLGTGIPRGCKRSLITSPRNPVRNSGKRK